MAALRNRRKLNDQPAELRTGAAREAEGHLLAHAWVESHGRPWFGGGDAERYTRVLAARTAAGAEGS